MNNKITHVRNLCIEGMERLLHPEENEEFTPEKAKQLAALAKVAVDSAKAETAHLNLLIKHDLINAGTGFIPVETKQIG